MTFDLTPTLLRALPEYRIRHSSRARHVNLRISATNGLVVVVPRGFDEQLIPRLIHEQRAWIQSRFKQCNRSPGVNEGWQRPTRVALAAANEDWAIEYRIGQSPTVRISTRHNHLLRATGAVDDQATLCAALRRWLKRRAQQLLPSRLAELAEIHNFNFSRVSIRLQRTRWGSCSTRGTISLNAKLLFVSPELLDHVLLHELCHTIQPNHSAAFHALMADLIPNHRSQRAELREAWTTVPGWTDH